MKKHLLWIAALTCGILSANPIRNSSFELNDIDWGLYREIPFNSGAFRPPVIDAAEKMHGEQSLRIENPAGETLEFYGHEYQLEKGKTYTFSWYMKSDKPLSIMCGQYSGEAETGWTTQERKGITANTKWTRYSLTFTAKTAKSWYFPMFRWNQKGTLWFDAMQIDEGESAKPYRMADFEVELDSPDHIAVGQKDFSTTLWAINHTNKPQMLNAVLKTVETQLPGVSIPDIKVSQLLEPGKVTAVRIPIKNMRYGHFNMSGVCEMNGKRRNVGNFIYARQVNIPARKYDYSKDFLTGFGTALRTAHRVHPPKQVSYLGMGQDYIDTLKKSGAPIIRMMEGGYSWKNVEPVPGKFVWTETDPLIQYGYENGFKIMLVFGENAYLRDFDPNRRRCQTSYPDWVRKLPGTRLYPMKGSWDGYEPDAEALNKYAEQLARHLKGKIFAYEITNEPNIMLPNAKAYTSFVNAGKTLKKIDPSVKIIGGCVTTDYGGEMEWFLKQMGKEGHFQSFDAVSFHPYANRLDSSPAPAQHGIQSIHKVVSEFRKDLPLWNSELYYINKAPSNSGYVQYLAQHGRHFLRRHVIDFGEKVSVSILAEENMFFNSELAEHWELGTGHRFLRWNVPRDVLSGVAVASYLLNGATLIKKFDWPSGVNGAYGIYFRTKEGAEAILAWGAEEARHLSMNLPDGNYQIHDMYLNPVNKTRKISLTEYPVIITGKNLKEIAEKLTLEGTEFFKIVSAFEIPGSKTELALHICNASSYPIQLAVRPEFSANPEIKYLKVDEHAVFRFAETEKVIPGKTKIYLSDGNKHKTIVLPALQRRSIVSGENADLPEFSFRTKSDPAKFYLTVDVHDPERGPRVKDQPWTGDAIELFFDSNPLGNIEKNHNGQTVRRLFFAPKSSNGLPVHISGEKIDISTVQYSISEHKKGYTLNCAIPWNAIGMKGPGLFGFNIKVDNSSLNRAFSDRCWSGKDSHRIRSGYGLWNVTEEKLQENKN